jgi:hypothetical protein
MLPSERRHFQELVAHGVAFCMSAGVGAIILLHYYGFFERITDSPSAARDAFLTCVFVTGGVGPTITALYFLVRSSRGG